MTPSTLGRNTINLSRDGGHSTFEYVINMAHKAGVKKVFFFHHDPLRTDEQLRDLLFHYREKVKGKTALQMELAREGLEIQL